VRQDCRVPTSLRLLSIDARGFGGDRAAVARTISGAPAEVACVHGGPHLLRWRTISAALGRRAGLVVVTGGRPAGGNLLLSTLAVDVRAVSTVEPAGGTRRARPGAALAALRLRGSDFLLVGATLVGNSAQRLAQAGEVRTAVGRLVPDDPPVIISAEGADRPGTAVWQSLVGNGVGVAEHIFADGRLTVADAVPLPDAPPAAHAVLVTLEV
jgi:hypothetical protein